MSFGAMAAWQAWLLVAGAAALAIWLFRLRVRPRRVAIPSLVVWQHVLAQPRAQTLWERIRRAVSLAATAAIAVALAVAFARPGPGAAGGEGGRRLIVLDSSWSMRARTADGGTRWERALAAARALARSAAGEPVALATTADGIVEGPTTDLALIEAALDGLTPSGGQAGGWPRAGDADSVHFITDGVLRISRPPGFVVTHSVFEPASNVAITAFDVRPAVSAGSAGVAYLEVANFADEPRDVRLTITRGTTVVRDATMRLGAGEASREALDLAPEGDPRLLARAAADGDALPDDNEAVAWIPEADPTDVVVVSSEPGAIAPLLGRSPQLRTTFVSPRDYTPAAGDVVIFDRIVPAAAPDRPALFIAPLQAVWLGRAGSEERTPRWTASAPHPVLAGVDPFTVAIERANGISGERLEVLARSERGTPLVAIVDEPDLRAVVLTFALDDSNLATAPAFPVLIGNAIDWLAHPGVPTPAAPGPLVMPRGVSRVLAPDGSAVPVVVAGDRSVAHLPAPGLYRVDAGGGRTVIAVNAGDPVVSDLSRTSLPDAAARAIDAGGVSSWPWWLYALGATIALVAAEWATWLRRITV
jgi:hypothetical protein